MHPFFRSMRQRSALILAAMIALALASLVVAGMTGSVALPLADLPAALSDVIHGKSSTLAATLLDLRLSRALTAFGSPTLMGEP